MACAICLSDVVNSYTTICNHIFCESCIKLWKRINITCPLCRTQIQKIEYIPPYDAVYIRDMERINIIASTDSTRATMLLIEYSKWLNGSRNSRPVI